MLHYLMVHVLKYIKQHLHYNNVSSAPVNECQVHQIAVPFF